jgi:uncharacterized FlgJ-related protein
VSKTQTAKAAKGAKAPAEAVVSRASVAKVAADKPNVNASPEALKRASAYSKLRKSANAFEEANEEACCKAVRALTTLLTAGLAKEALAALAEASK